MEPRYCPQCGTANAASFRFCQKCGSALVDVSAQGKSVARIDETLMEPSSMASSAAQPLPTPPVHRPAQAQPPPYVQPIDQMGKGGFSVADIWGPFAGYGERGRHVSWLLNNRGERAEHLRDAVANRFQERRIPGARIETRTLTGRGIAVERRPYYLVRRGITTGGLYVARFGQDLFISQVTYAKGAINPLRVVILFSMLLFQLYMVIGYTQSVNDAFESAFGSFNLMIGLGGGDTGALGLLLCCVGPLGALNSLALSLVGLHMIYKFVTDKDPLAVLRTPPNEFQYDDIIALEKAVEETVRQSLDAIGIDSALMPPAPEYGIKRRLI